PTRRCTHDCPSPCRRCDSECVENYRQFALTPRYRTQRFFSESNIAASCWRIGDCRPELGRHIRSDARREATNRVVHGEQRLPSEGNGSRTRVIPGGDVKRETSELFTKHARKPKRSRHQPNRRVSAAATSDRGVNATGTLVAPALSQLAGSSYARASA